MLGVGNSFSKNADYSYFTGKRDVFLESFNHVAAIEVAETESMFPPMVMKTYESNLDNITEDFVCDRPFAYIIYDFLAQKTIFMGTFRDPQPN